MTVKLEPIFDNNDHFLLTADEPVRVEVGTAPSGLIAHIYLGVEIDMEQSPIGAFDTSIENEGWVFDGVPGPDHVNRGANRWTA